MSRFRQIFDAYLTAPGELGSAFAPDTLQVEAPKPLAPLELPIHDALEQAVTAGVRLLVGGAGLNGFAEVLQQKRWDLEPR